MTPVDVTALVCPPFLVRILSAKLISEINALFWRLVVMLGYLQDNLTLFHVLYRAERVCFTTL